MVYLENTEGAQAVLLPKNIDGIPARFAMTSTAGLATVIDEAVSDLPAFSTYYSVALELPSGTKPGEYEYSLTAADGTELSRGIAVVSAPVTGTKEYHEEITFKQYGGQAD